MKLIDILTSVIKRKGNHINLDDLLIVMKIYNKKEI